MWMKLVNCPRSQPSDRQSNLTVNLAVNHGIFFKIVNRYIIHLSPEKKIGHDICQLVVLIGQISRILAHVPCHAASGQ